jgi:hypothetical protein
VEDPAYVDDPGSYVDIPKQSEFAACRKRCPFYTSKSLLLASGRWQAACPGMVDGPLYL